MYRTANILNPSTALSVHHALNWRSHTPSGTQTAAYRELVSCIEKIVRVASGVLSQSQRAADVVEDANAVRAVNPHPGCRASF